MRLSFVETMQGALRDAGGAEHPVAFEVSARGEGRGFFRLAGVVRAAPWAAEAPAEGSLEMGLRFLRYRVRFPAAGGTWELRGEKTPSPRAPVRSMTLLPVVLRDAGGAEVAWGTLAFDLKDLPRFLLSWLPFLPSAALRLEARREALGQR